MATKNFQAASIYDSAALGPIELEEAKAAWNYRHLILQFIRRDVVSRYKRSALGVAWTMLNPLGMMLVLSLVFSGIFGRGQNYPLFVLAGLIGWTFFSQTTSIGQRQLLWGGSLLKQVYMPRTALPISAVGTGLINLVLSLIPLALVMLATSAQFSISLVYLPIPIILLGLFALGVSMIVSSITIYFPDVAEIYEIALRAWMYLTPIMYPLDIFPERFRWVLNLNPMFHLINLFRIPVVDGIFPSAKLLAVSFLVALVPFLIGWIVFSRNAEQALYRN